MREISFVPEHLMCESEETPVGIQCESPRLSWRARHSERGMSQCAWQVQVATDPFLFGGDQADCWDSGKVVGTDSIGVRYGGAELKPEKRYYWRVRLWDSCDRESKFSEIAWFDTGIAKKDMQHGHWISAPDASCDFAPLLRKAFSVEKEIEAAYLYVSGIGYSECYINGRKIGSQVLDPGFTDYQKRVLYRCYRVEEKLQKGANAIGVILGNGWLGNDDPYITRHTGRWLSAPKLLLQLNIRYRDGSYQALSSNTESGWKSAHSPILQNNIYNGETYDARLEQNGFSEDGFVPGEEWLDAVEVPAPGGELCRQRMEPIEVIRQMSPLSVNKPAAGVYVFDMGQNMAGWVRLQVTGPRGCAVTLRYAEVLYEDGTVNQENLMEAKATDVYILRGEGKEFYEPRFTYHGFRYVQIEGYPGEPDMDQVTGCVVRNAVPVTGCFRCSNDLLNQIQKNVLWTEWSNLYSIPTDCPQRSERMGWLNDVTARAEEMVYNMGVSRFLAKWMQDITDTIDPTTGAIKDTAPALFSRRQDGDPMDLAYVLIPWLLYLHYHDTDTMREHYEGMQGWIRFLLGRCEELVILHRDSDLGDWASPRAYILTGDNPRSAITPDELLSTGYLYYNVVLMGKMAGLLEREQDRQFYEQLSGQIEAAFRKRFYDPMTGLVGTGSQGCQALALWVNLVPTADRAAVAARLAEAVRKEDYHLTTGNQCTKYVLQALCMEGYVEEAYRLATQTTYPSWGYMIENGATTIWERWEHDVGGGMNSHNHPMYASVSGWFYKYLAGIRVEENGAGFEHVMISPCIPEGLDWAEASLETIRGTLVVHWNRSDRQFQLKLTLPFGCTADVRLPLSVVSGGITQVREGQQIVWKIRSEKLRPDHVLITVGAGSYCFIYE